MSDIKNHNLLSDEKALAFFKDWFQDSLFFWPIPYSEKPGFFDRAKRKRERKIRDALAQLGLCEGKHISDAQRDLFWREVRLGQAVFEDASTAMWRPWQVILGLREPTQGHENYADAARRLVQEKIDKDAKVMNAGSDHGFDDGHTCGRDGCEGVIEVEEVQGCYCHTGNPPCSSCTGVRLFCPVCEWIDEEI